MYICIYLSLCIKSQKPIFFFTAKLMQYCSNELVKKLSNPNTSRMPMNGRKLCYFVWFFFSFYFTPPPPLFCSSPIFFILAIFLLLLGGRFFFSRGRGRREMEFSFSLPQQHTVTHSKKRRETTKQGRESFELKHTQH